MVKDCSLGASMVVADQPITRSTASCAKPASCTTDDVDHRTDGTRHAGIIWRAGPRTGPRSRPLISFRPVTVRNIVRAPRLCGCGWVEPRFPRHALQLPDAAVFEGDPRPGHQVLDRLRHQYLARRGQRGHPRLRYRPPCRPAPRTRRYAGPAAPPGRARAALRGSRPRSGSPALDRRTGRRTRPRRCQAPRRGTGLARVSENRGGSLMFSLVS